MSQRTKDEYYLGLALQHAVISRDPSTKVGAILLNPDGKLVAVGWNKFPRGVADTFIRWNDRETKLNLVVHAEMNAVLGAAYAGIPVKGSTLYVAATDGIKEIWGGPPCVRCTVECMQAGVVQFVSRPMKIAPSRWHDSIRQAHSLIIEAGLSYREVPLP